MIRPTVDETGCARRSTFLDIGDFGSNDELNRMSRLNDRTIATMKSARPDLALIREHYAYIRRFVKSDFGTPTSSGHVGDQ